MATRVFVGVSLLADGFINTGSDNLGNGLSPVRCQTLNKMYLNVCCLRNGGHFVQAPVRAMRAYMNRFD